jgi:Rod binding domain-containing protein
MVIGGTRVMGHGTSQVAEINNEMKEQMRLRKACSDFEAFLVGYLLRQMWQAAEAIGGEKPFISQTYRDLFTFEVAQGLTPSLRLGIAEMLYRALSDAEQMGGKAENPSPSQKHRR